ncbi:hypothetical protein SAMN05444157_0118 [Frankineae bacterium MT45]|nr:hypothetical protein SAMN05444157_0118 [Frankineae bacterium MT45]
MATTRLTGLRNSFCGLSQLALASAFVALLSLIPVLPTFIKAPAAGFFVLVGPGAAILVWVKGLPTYASNALVILLSVAVNILVSYLAVLEGLWHPTIQMLLLQAGTVASILMYELSHFGESARVARATAGADVTPDDGTAANTDGSTDAEDGAERESIATSSPEAAL